MKVDVTFTARDGRTFNDPYKCEDYEKSLGIIKGSIAEAIKNFKSLRQDYLVNLMLIYFDEGDDVPTFCHFISKRFNDNDGIYITFSDVVKKLESINKPHAQCQYIGYFFEDFSSDKCGSTVSINHAVMDFLAKVNK